MSKVLGLMLMVGALYVGISLYTEGREHAFGGIFAPIEPLERDSLAASALSPAAQFENAPRPGQAPQRVKASDTLRKRFSPKR